MRVRAFGVQVNSGFGEDGRHVLAFTHLRRNRHMLNGSIEVIEVNDPARVPGGRWYLSPLTAERIWIPSQCDFTNGYSTYCNVECLVDGTWGQTDQRPVLQRELERILRLLSAALSTGDELT